MERVAYTKTVIMEYENGTVVKIVENYDRDGTLTSKTETTRSSKKSKQTFSNFGNNNVYRKTKVCNFSKFDIDGNAKNCGNIFVNDNVAINNGNINNNTGEINIVNSSGIFTRKNGKNTIVDDDGIVEWYEEGAFDVDMFFKNIKKKKK